MFNSIIPALSPTTDPLSSLVNALGTQPDLSDLVLAVFIAVVILRIIDRLAKVIVERLFGDDRGDNGTAAG